MVSWFSKIFGGGSDAAAPAAEDYKGFAITPQPQKDAGGWRISALIQKDGKSHTMIRADVLNNEEAAVTASVSKAKQVIDEQGDRIFG